MRDLEFQGLESIWLELKLKLNTILFGHFYRSPNSSNEVLEKIDGSVDLALDNDISDVIITGDLNLNFLDSVSRNKHKSIVYHYSLHQIADEHTHFTKTSSSSSPEIQTMVVVTLVKMILKFHRNFFKITVKKIGYNTIRIYLISVNL